jgi:hypothetical protein
MARVATPETVPAVGVGVNEEALCRAALSVHHVHEMGKHSPGMELDGHVDNAVQGIGEDSVFVSRDASDLAKLAQVFNDEICWACGRHARDPYSGDRVGWCPTMDTRPSMGGPANTSRKTLQCRKAWFG